jgi:hypothetical protein
LDPNRKQWNAGQQKLKRAFAAGDREWALELFLSQHAMHHSAKMARSGLWSFEDEVLNGLTDGQVRTIPRNGEHSIAWILLHLARIEDISMSMLVAGTCQLFTRDGWAKKLKVDIVHSANKMSGADVAGLSARVNVTALKSYRLAVGRRTRQIVQKLKAEDFKKKVEPHRIQNVLDEGAVIPEAMEIIRYWGSRTIAGLLLMPATRHNVLHLNEALRIRKMLWK